MEEEFKAEVAEVRQEFHPEDIELSEIRIRPRKGDIAIGNFSILWLPWKIGPEGLAEPGFSLDLS